MAGWFGRLFGRKAKELTYDQIASLIDGTGESIVAGYSVTEKTALQVSTVLACVKVIADGCATPDLHVYREKNVDGRIVRERAINIPEYRLLSRRPNEWQTSLEWRRQMTMHAALTGSALSIKVRGMNGRVRELIPVEPGSWTVEHNARYRLRYRCHDKFGLIGEFEPEDVFLLQGPQWSYVQSLNAVALARSAIGLAIATERSQEKMHGNGLRPSGVYSVDGTLTQEQHDRLSLWLRTRAERVGDPLVMDRNAKWTPLGLTGVDAQHVETRRLQVEEICRAYGVFPIMVGHSDKAATFASSEAFFSAHRIHTLAPWHKAWTQRIDEHLLDGSGPLFAEFDSRYMVAGSMNDRATFARTMVEMGVYTRNELRDEEGKDPLPGLDEPLTPLNMTRNAEEEAAAAASAATADAEARAMRADAKALRDELRELRAAQMAQAGNHGPVIHNHVSPPPVNVPVSVTVPDSKTDVTNQIDVHVPVPAVHLEATLPEVKAGEVAVVNQINVEPAQVTVVDNHPTRAVQTVERGDDNEIARTVTRYERDPK